MRVDVVLTACEAQRLNYHRSVVEVCSPGGANGDGFTPMSPGSSAFCSVQFETLPGVPPARDGMSVSRASYWAMVVTAYCPAVQKLQLLCTLLEFFSQC